MSILEEIIARKKTELHERKKRLPLSHLRNSAEKRTANLVENRFLQALSQNKLQIIAEVKKASPSKGTLVKDFDYLRIASEYAVGGAAAVSVITEEHYFGGKLDDMREIAAAIKLPVLRKDFVIDEYQVYEAAANGAAALLLIAALLTPDEISKLTSLARSLKMNTLVEVHDLAELKEALKSNATIIGINNRNLKTFHVDMNTSLNLAKYIPASFITVSESGIRSRDEIKRLEKAGFNAALVGEILMRQNDRAGYLRYLRGKPPCG